MTDIERVNRYCDRVLSGELPSCRYVIKAVERWKNDLQRSDLYYDNVPFERFCKFARQFKHYKGDLAGTYFAPEDWQLFVAANLIGLKCRATDRRKYTYADVYLPRKNGKTFFASIFALYFLLMDGEAGAEVYTAAVDQAQARLCYDASAEVLRNSIFEPLTKPYQWGMKYPAKAGVYKPMSKDTKNKDGLNIHAAICDERHAWPNNDLYDVIKTGMGARSQPMLLSISTAGTDTSNPYFTDIAAYKEILDGLKAKDNHFLMLYCPDEGDDWKSEDTWRKVNPNLGVSLSLTYMRNECQEAQLRGGTYEVAFKTKNLNLWVDAPTVWIPDDDVKACNADLDLSLLRGEDCYVGIDLASKNDICATAFFFPKYMAVKYLFIIPAEKLAEKEDRVDYRKWQQDGYITTCSGRVLNEEWYMETLLRYIEPFNVKAIAYDPWGMWDLKCRFGKYEDVLMEYRQDIRYMSVPTKRLESEVLKHRMNFLYNPVIRWMMRNVVVYIDANANVKLDKAKSRQKIDGVVATVDAIGAWLNLTNGESRDLYADHELRTISF